MRRAMAPRRLATSWCVAIIAIERHESYDELILWFEHDLFDQTEPDSAAALDSRASPSDKAGDFGVHRIVGNIICREVIPMKRVFLPAFVLMTFVTASAQQDLRGLRFDSVRSASGRRSGLEGRGDLA